MLVPSGWAPTLEGKHARSESVETERKKENRISKRGLLSLVRGRKGKDVTLHDAMICPCHHYRYPPKIMRKLPLRGSAAALAATA
jgi:hypothetical protein